MISILEELHKYVPKITTTTQVKVIQNDETEEESTIYEDNVHRILLGGDQLTAARVRGYAQILRELCINLQLLKLCVKTGMQKELF